MMRALGFSIAVLAAACSQPNAPRQTAILPTCDTLDLSGGQLTPGACRIEAGGQVFNVTYADVPEGVAGGAVTIEVIGPDGAVAQSILEQDVSEYRHVSLEDIDGDGRIDIRIPIATGNVNTQSALWVFNGERGLYQRVGDVSGISIERTADGYLAVPARSSAVAWNVAFYRFDEGGIHPILTLLIEAPAGRSTEPGCRIESAPGLRDVNLDEAAARAKFCAEPAAQVFGP